MYRSSEDEPRDPLPCLFIDSPSLGIIMVRKKQSWPYVTCRFYVNVDSCRGVIGKWGRPTPRRAPRIAPSPQAVGARTVLPLQLKGRARRRPGGYCRARGIGSDQGRLPIAGDVTQGVCPLGPPSHFMSKTLARDPTL